MTDHQRPETIAGYTHPENAQGRQRAATYKTFTEGQKPKKKEKFGNTVAGNQYASFDTTQDVHVTRQEIEKERGKFDATAYSENKQRPSKR